MHVLFVARGYPTDKYKTYGIFEFDQAKALAKKGVRVTYAAVDLRSIRRWRSWGIEQLEKDGVKIYAINIPIGRVPVKLLRNLLLKSLRRLYRTIVKKEGKADLIHAHFTNSAYAASYLKEDTGLPLVVTEHSSRINANPIEKDLRETAQLAYGAADRLIAVSQALVDRIDDEFNHRAIYIPNMVDLEVFKYSPKKKEDNFKFVSTGNLIEIKRMDLTIEAFYRSFKDSPGVSLKIFGQGTDRDKLQSLIESYNLEDRVRLMGLCSREEIADTLRESDCFVLASRSETFGVAYIEALAMGLAVIATKCGGPEGFVNRGNGKLIPVDDLDALSDAMTYMYENIEEFNREEIALETKEKFSSDIIAEELIEVYRDLL